MALLKMETGARDYPSVEYPAPNIVGGNHELNTEEIRESVELLRSERGSRSERTNAQNLVEMAMVTSVHCDTKTIDGIRVGLFQLSAEDLSERLSFSQLYQPGFVQEMACLADAVVYSNPKEGITRPTVSQRVRGWMKKIRKIGKNSVYGYALQTGLMDSDDFFIIKAPRAISIAKTDEMDLSHEAAVGFYVTNKIRNLVPTFVYVYSAFTCSAPVVEGDIPITWCSGIPTVTYIVLENIHNSVTLGEFLEDCTEREFLEIYLQVLNALNIAVRENGYTHYDLHASNVLVHRLPDPVAIRYFGANDHRTSKERYLVTNCIATIIDYGASRFTYDGVNFGLYGVSSHNIFVDRAFPIHDAYKLLCFSADKIIRFTKRDRRTKTAKRLNGLLNIVDRIYSFFPYEQYPSVVDRVYHATHLPISQGKDIYDASVDYLDMSLDDIIEKVEGIMEIIMPEAPIDILIAGEMEYPPLPEFFIHSQAPSSLFEYCDASATIIHKLAPSEKRDTLLEWLKDHSDLQGLYKKEQRAALRWIREARILEEGISIPVMEEDRDKPTFYTAKYIENYEKQILSLLRMKDLVAAKLTFWNRDSRCALENAGMFEQYRNKWTEVYDETDRLRKRYSQLATIVKMNGQYMDTIRRWEKTGFNNITSTSKKKDIFLFLRRRHKLYVLAL